MTDAQVRRLREKRMEGKTVSAAAAAAGMGERTAHRWQRGALPSAAKAPRTWRPREDPFADVWLSEVVPRLVGGWSDARRDRKAQKRNVYWSFVANLESCLLKS